MGTFVFNDDYANNWTKGQEVECEIKNNEVLVDNVAIIPVKELIKS